MAAVILRARPVDVRACQFTGDNVHEVNLDMLGRRAYGSSSCLREYPGNQTYPATHGGPAVSAEVWNGTDHQWQPVRPGDWILVDPAGSFYAAPAEVIAKKYDVIGPARP